MFLTHPAHTPLERGNLLLRELFGDNWALLPSCCRVTTAMWHMPLAPAD
jgi:hypothetical protein